MAFGGAYGQWFTGQGMGAKVAKLGLLFRCLWRDLYLSGLLMIGVFLGVCVSVSS